MPSLLVTRLLLLLVTLMTATIATATEAQPQHDQQVVHLVGSFAPLFSGRSLSDCHSYNDTSCRGGIAAATAFQRYYTSDGSPSVTLHRLDKQSQFVQTHPLGWSVNRLVLQNYLGYKFFSSSPSLLLQHKDDTWAVSQRDISDLQTHKCPLLLTNAAVPPSVSWHPYVQRVHFDQQTNLAIMSLAGNGEPMASPNQVEAVKTALRDIEKENQIRGCTPSKSLFDKYLKEFPIATATATATSTAEGQAEVDSTGATTADRLVIVDMAWDNDNDNDTHNHNNSSNRRTRKIQQQSSSASTTSTSTSPSNCWIPILYFSDFEPPAFTAMIQSMIQFEHPPAVIIDGGGNDIDGTYSQPIQYQTPNTARPNSTMWITSMRYSSGNYYQHTFTLTPDNQRVANLTNILLDLEDDFISEMKDEQYARDIAFIRTLADQAEANDPVVGISANAMPVAREGDYRRCKGGECEQGNLFADALRWRANSDVAFVTSGGLRGNGWPAGNVTVSNIWSTLPFPNTMCTGTMTGVSLFKLVDYSMSVATFESGETQEGGRLLQVSGMKIVYNTQLQDHRVISIDVWDNDLQSYQPIERLKYYKFATDSYLCGAYDPYPTLLGAEGLVIDGEVAGTIGDDLHQNIVGEYLTSLDQPYQALREGRLTNNTIATEALNLIQTPEGCPPQTYWVETKLSCWKCPNSSHVAFSDSQLEFAGLESGVAQWYPGRILLVNRELESFRVFPKTIPDWLTFTFVSARNQTTAETASTTGDEDPVAELQLQVDGTPTLLKPGDALSIDFAVSAEHLEAGTALGTVSFGILDGGDFPGCVDNGDATFDVLLRVTPSPELNQLGRIRYVGFSLMGVALLMAAAFALWTSFFKRTRVVQKMQPLFLIMICVGVGIMSLGMGSLSLDDEIVSLQWCNFACMSLPWFVSMGWTITFAAIYSKLWRINKLFGNAHFRRITVSERDALLVFSILFVLNFVILLLWTLLDPMQWVRRPVVGEEAWNTYGVCSSDSTGDALMGLALGINAVALVLAAVEAYKARNISGEFSESKQLGLAVATWVQVIVVAVPVLFLIDSENVTARYFLQVGLIFCLSLTMLLNIFTPMVLHLRRLAKRGSTADHRGNVKVSGLHGDMSATMGQSSLLSHSVRRSVTNYGGGGGCTGHHSFSAYRHGSHTAHGGGLDLERLQIQIDMMNSHTSNGMNSESINLDASNGGRNFDDNNSTTTGPATSATTAANAPANTLHPPEGASGELAVVEEDPTVIEDPNMDDSGVSMRIQ